MNISKPLFALAAVTLSLGLSGCAFLFGEQVAALEPGYAQKVSPLRPGVNYIVSSASSNFSEKIQWGVGATTVPFPGGFTSSIMQEHGDIDGKYYKGGGYGYVNDTRNNSRTFSLSVFSKNLDQMQCIFAGDQVGSAAPTKESNFTPKGGARVKIDDCRIKIAP